MTGADEHCHTPGPRHRREAEGVLIALPIGALDAGLGEHRVDFLGYGGDQVAQELSGDHGVGFFVSHGKGERADALDGDEQAELAFFRTDLGWVSVNGS